MKNILIITLLIPLLSGCGMFKAATDFTYGLGKKLPVYGGNRCGDTWFCFGDKAKKPNNTATAGRRKPSQQGSGQENYYIRDRSIGRDVPPQAMPIPPRGGGATPISIAIPPPPAYGTPVSEYKFVPPTNGGKPSGLKPWEENPEWKKDLPASPIDPLRNSLDW